MKSLIYVFVGGMGPRSGSYLYDGFHYEIEKQLGDYFVDSDFPDSLLITTPSMEDNPYHGDYNIDLAFLQAQIELLLSQYEKIIVAPLCVTVSDVVKQACEQVGSNRVKCETILDFIESKFPNGATLLCSQELANQNTHDSKNTYVQCTRIIKNYAKPHIVGFLRQIVFDVSKETDKSIVLACTELSTVSNITTLGGVFDAPLMFVRNLVREYIHENRR